MRENMLFIKHIPHELVVEILSWLPIKSLSRFRFVSKTWFQLITANPQFANLHFERSRYSNPNPSILTWRSNNASLYSADYTSCNEPIALEVPFTYHTCVCGVSNGLLGLYSSRNEEVYVFNPLTKDYVTVSCLIPTPSWCFPLGHIRYARFGFGFDHYSNKYKFVRFFCGYNTVAYTYHSQVSVYTLGVDSMWRIVEDDLMVCVYRIPRVVVNGALHWVTSAPCNEILAFDLKDEVIRKMTPPNGVNFDWIVELGGLLCVIEKHHLEYIEIWAMEEYGVVTSWSRKFRIGKFEIHNRNLDVLGIARNGEIILNNTDSENLILYNPETKLVVKLTEFQNHSSFPHLFVGSFISPRFIT